MRDLGYGLAVMSAATYGGADFLGGLATKRGSAIGSVVVFSQMTGLLVVLAALPFLPPSSPTSRDIAWGAASGLAGGIGLALLYHGLATGVMSVVAPVTAVCSVVVPLAVGVAQGERPSPAAAAGILLAVAAIVLISQSGPLGDERASTGVPVAVVSGIAIGVFLVCLARTGRSAGLWPLIPARAVSVSMFALGGLFTRRPQVPRRATLPLVIGGGSMDMIANVLYLLAVRNGALGIVATLTSLYPASTILLARLVLRERLRLVQHAGVVCAVVAIALIVSG